MLWCAFLFATAFNTVYTSGTTKLNTRLNGLSTTTTNTAVHEQQLLQQQYRQGCGAKRKPLVHALTGLYLCPPRGSEPRGLIDSLQQAPKYAT